MYVDDWETKGAIIMADEMLYCYNEKGKVGLVKADPDGFEVVSEFKITKEEAAGYMDAFPVDELPEQIVIGDKTVNLKDLATDEDTEDIFNAMAVVSGHLTKKMVAEELEKAGFVMRLRSQEDRRVVLISRTEKDRAWQEAYIQVSREMTDLFYDEFSENEIDEFENYLRRIFRNLSVFEDDV